MNNTTDKLIKAGTKLNAFIESLSEDFPKHEVSAIHRAYGLCFEGLNGSSSDDDDNSDLSIDVPDNATPQQLDEIGRSASDALDQAKETAIKKKELDSDMKKTEEELKRKTDEIERQNG